jgi:hypothetical protein
MENIMRNDDRSALADSELDAVSGGMLSLGRAATAPQSTDQLTQMMQQLLQQLQAGRGASTTSG